MREIDVMVLIIIVAMRRVLEPRAKEIEGDERERRGFFRSGGI
jgi:hypothetical protein